MKHQAAISEFVYKTAFNVLPDKVYEISDCPLATPITFGNQVAANITRAFMLRENAIDAGLERMREWTIGPNSTFGYCPARKDEE